MEWALPHPDDPSRLVRIEDLLAEMRAEAQADHAKALSRLDAQGASLAALGGRVTKLESDTRVAELTAQVAGLLARVKALELPTGAAYGVDVSRHQTAAEVTAAVAQEGYEFVIINATTGLKSISSALATNTQIARQSGDLTGFYHWSQTINDLATTADKSDPIGEARHFVANSGWKPGDILVLDHEEQLGTWAQRVSYALAWLDEVKRLTGITPLIYLNWYWIQSMRTAATQAQWDRLTAYPLWLADPSGVPGKHDTVSAKDGSNSDDWPILIHQWSTKDPDGTELDRNWTPDIARLRALA